MNLPETTADTACVESGNTPNGATTKQATVSLGGSFFAIPSSDALEFARLPQGVRTSVLNKLKCLHGISRADSLKSGCMSMAAEFHGVRGFSAARLRANFDEYMSSGGDWRTLLDKAQAGPSYWQTDDIKLPAAFLEYWRGLCQRNQRKCRPMHRALIRQWRQWRAGDSAAAIPGYETCPPPFDRTPIPRGWSERNLMRYAPSKFELTASRIGRSAADEYRPKVFTTRAGLAVGQYYMFDDFWHDFKVNLIGQRHAQRLLQFHAHDLFSGCNFARGLKPVIENEMTGAMERLKEVEMVFLVAHVLGNIGYRPDGTVLVVEHGTAAIREDLEKLLHDLTAGKVRVERSGMQGAAAFAGQYAGRGKGNYRFKASLESLGNLIHNETSDMLLIPGQVGLGRDRQPEELPGREKHNDALIRAMSALPAERAQLLRLPFLEYQQAVRLVTEIHDRINERHDHELEGWMEAGLVTTEWRLTTHHDWLPLSTVLAMPEMQRRAVEALITTDANLTRTRKLSPAEVFKAGRKQLTTLPTHAVAMILSTKEGREVSVRSGMLTFDDRALSGDPLRFLARLGSDMIPDGEKFRVVLNPMDLDALHLFNAKGGYVGSCPRWQSICRSDADALHRQCGRAAKVEAELLKPVADRGAELTRQRIKDALHNAAVLAGKPITEEERDRADQIERNVKTVGAEALDTILSRDPARNEIAASETGSSQTDEDLTDLIL